MILQNGNGQWKYIIKADLKWAYYQILLAKCSRKYVGIATPFKGTYVYQRSVMGLPGSEDALEEVLCRILGEMIQRGGVVKMADDLYCGANTIDELLDIWSEVLERLSSNGIKLSPDKTVICPASTIILGWLWENGTIRPTPHRVNALMTCEPPPTIKGLRSFVGAFKFMSRSLPAYSDVLGPLESACAAEKSGPKLVWSDELLAAFDRAKKHLKEVKPVILPHESDELHIVTDAAQRCGGMASAMYVVRQRKPRLAGFFNAKRRGHQVGWLPCESEALCIALSIRHFAPYIIQSRHRTKVLTDSKACVQSYQKLCKGEFSLSSRLTTFLSLVSRYGVQVMHVAGKDNILSDFCSRNPVECGGQCQICEFVSRIEQSVVGAVQVSDILSGNSRVPYSSRPAWVQIQQDCPDLTMVAKYLQENTVPSRKKKGLSDVRRYLGVVSLSGARDLLIVKHSEPFRPSTERIVIPRSVAEGLLTALHIQLCHPSKHQLKLVFTRAFFALDMDSMVSRVVDGCHTCAALKNVPSKYHEQSTTVPDKIASSFSADVLRGNSQFILLLRESISSFTDAMIIADEKSASLRDGIITLASKFRSSLSHPAVIRTDPASSLRSLVNDRALKSHSMSIQLGDEKNPNKNPIAEAGIKELRAELVKIQPLGGKITPVVLSQAVSNMNSRIRQNKLSSYEVWTQREMTTGDSLQLNDTNIIQDKIQQRVNHHVASAKYKARGKTNVEKADCKKGDIVYLYVDREKTKSRDKYLVIHVNGDFAVVQKFTGDQLRARRYNVRLTDIISVPKTDVPEVATNEESKATPPAVVQKKTSLQPPVKKYLREYPNIDVYHADSSEESDDEYTYSSFLRPNVIVPTVPTQGRPRREIRLPTHLEDYVVGSDHDDTNIVDPESPNPDAVNAALDSSANQDSSSSDDQPDDVIEEHTPDHTSSDSASDEEVPSDSSNTEAVPGGRPTRTKKPPERYGDA